MKKNKVKLFLYDNVDDLQDSINSWLEGHEMLEKVISIDFAVDTTTEDIPHFIAFVHYILLVEE